MKYTTILYVIYSDDTADKKAIYDATSSDEAIAFAHKYMGQYMNGTNVYSVMTLAVNSVGSVYVNFHWVKPEETVSYSKSI